MEDELRAKLLANDELSLEIDEHCQDEEKGSDGLKRVFREFYHNINNHNRTVRLETLGVSLFHCAFQISVATVLPSLKITWENVTVTVCGRIFK